MYRLTNTYQTSEASGPDQYKRVCDRSNNTVIPAPPCCFILIGAFSKRTFQTITRPDPSRGWWAAAHGSEGRRWSDADVSQRRVKPCDDPAGSAHQRRRSLFTFCPHPGGVASLKVEAALKAAAYQQQVDAAGNSATLLQRTRLKVAPCKVIPAVM